ncbi:MAG: hypothetical protein E7032_05200 [Akkermansiaceae bacterium]|nr:hypothetical protein [Akkermansiaceae bacterium]
MRTIQQFLLSFILTGAVMAGDTDTQAYWNSLKQHSSPVVQAAVQQYNQGLCPLADILRAEEKYLTAELASASDTHCTELSQLLARNYKEQIRLEEVVAGKSTPKSLRLRQKLYTLEIEIMKR